MTRFFKRLPQKGFCVLLAAVLFVCIPAAARTSRAAQAAKNRFVANEAFIKDNATGLMWSRDANPAGRLLCWDDAADYIALLNKQHYAGHSDWKLPDLDEFRKLAEAAAETRARKGSGTVAAFLTKLGFMNVEASDYWCSTVSMYNETDAWSLNMLSGKAAAGNKALYMYVWPVRWEGVKKRPALRAQPAQADRKGP